MAGVLFWTGVFIISLIVLVKSSDYFTESAEKIGLHFKLPSFIVGVSIVAIGTSLPELVSSLIAVFEHSSEIVVGNVVGSNIANIFLILGITAIISRRKLKIEYELIHVDLPLLIGSALLFSMMIMDGKFTLIEAILSILGLMVYLVYTVSFQEKKESKTIKKEVKSQIEKEKLGLKVWIILLASGFFIYVGAKYTVDSVIQLSLLLNIGKEIIAVSAVALGTSLPELFVSISAIKKGNIGIAVGNVLGSNIFNTFAVMGIPALFGVLKVPPTLIDFGLPMMIIATFMYYFITQDNEITTWEGWMLIIFYIFFIAKTFSFS